MEPMTLIVPLTGSVSLTILELPEIKDHYVIKEQFWGTHLVKKECCQVATDSDLEWHPNDPQGSLIVDSTRVTEAFADKVEWTMEEGS